MCWVELEIEGIGVLLYSHSQVSQSMQLMWWLLYIMLSGPASLRGAVGKAGWWTCTPLNARAKH